MDNVTTMPSRGSSGRGENASLTPACQDVWIYRAVVMVLSAVLIATTFGAIYAEITSLPHIPEFLIALGSGALGALGGLLVPSPVGK